MIGLIRGQSSNLDLRGCAHQSMTCVAQPCTEQSHMSTLLFLAFELCGLPVVYIPIVLYWLVFTHYPRSPLITVASFLPLCSYPYTSRAFHPTKTIRHAFIMAPLLLTANGSFHFSGAPTSLHSFPVTAFPRPGNLLPCLIYLYDMEEIRYREELLLFSSPAHLGQASAAAYTFS